MPRQGRIQSGTGVYHVMMRGINRQQIFESEEDNRHMLYILSNLHLQYSPEGTPLSSPTCTIYAYCLMGNHFHLPIQERAWTIGEIIKSLASSYVYYFNKKYQRIGHLFQDRFKSEPVNDMSYFVTLLRYIHQNPVKAGIVSDARDYPWSSWCEYLCPDKEKNICNTRATLRRISLDDLAALVNQPLADNCTCIDIDEADIHAKSVHTDESVRQEILRLSQCQSIAEFQRKAIGERKEICRIMKERGAGVRQLSRITGISLGTISKC